MNWQVRRGVLAPAAAIRPGSPWWRTCNERLLRDGCEAVARAGGRGGAPSSPTIGFWDDFVAHPSARTWYRAHNSSIVNAYLDHEDLAAQENEAERFFLNVTLVRVLDAHALVSAPRLALGWLAPVSAPFGDPRVRMTGLFLSLSRVLPRGLPLVRDVAFYLTREAGWPGCSTTASSARACNPSMNGRPKFCKSRACAPSSIGAARSTRGSRPARYGSRNDPAGPYGPCRQSFRLEPDRRRHLHLPVGVVARPGRVGPGEVRGVHLTLDRSGGGVDYGRDRGRGQRLRRGADAGVAEVAADIEGRGPVHERPQRTGQRPRIVDPAPVSATAT